MSAAQRLGLLLLVGCAFILGSAWQFAGAQGEKVKAVQRWEYKTIRGVDTLNELGDEGWELVSVGQPEARLVYLYLKRPKQ
jgi:hypothetical protein